MQTWRPLFAALLIASAHAFSPALPLGLKKAADFGHHQHARPNCGSSLVMMAKKSSVKGNKVMPTAKGFTTKAKLVGPAKQISSPKISKLMAWMEKGGANVGKVCVADFNGLRGVAALQDIEAGEAIVTVPQDLSLNLGSEGSNPGYAAAQLVRIETDTERKAAGWFQEFLDVLPPYAECDTTDFFSDEELAALEWPSIIEETKRRYTMLRSTYDATQIASVQEKANNAKFTYEEFMWGVYQVVSRVLTIYTNADGGIKYLIPMIDFFNHDPSSANTLKCSQGIFSVVAGKRIKAGQQINIVYGSGLLNNDRIVQEYGFVEAECPNDVKQLVMPATKDLLPGFPFAGMGKDEQGLSALLAGFSTSAEEDEKLLPTLQGKMRIAVSFRLEKKRAIARALAQLSGGAVGTLDFSD